MKLRIGHRCVAISASNTRVMTFIPRSRKDLHFYEKMQSIPGVRFEEL
jgi:hypothetical protein